MTNGRAHREELEAVLATLERAAEHYPPDASWIPRQRADILISLGRMEECVAACDEVLRHERGDPEDWGRRAAALLDLGRHEDALPDAAEAIRLDPGNARPHATRGAALAALGREEEAEACWDEAIRIEPGDPAWRAGRARMRARRGNRPRLSPTPKPTGRSIPATPICSAYTRRCCSSRATPAPRPPPPS